MPPCPYCNEPMSLGDGSYWCMNKKCSEQFYPDGARDMHIERAFQVLKDCCDRDWKDETPEQVAVIVANAMHWRNEEIRKLRDQNAILSGALNESNRRQMELKLQLQGTK